MRRALTALAAIGVLLATIAVGAPAAGAHPYCGIRWGSLPRHGTGPAGTPTGVPHLVNVRAGQHACFDRLVFDLDGRPSTYWVTYVKQVRQDGSGNVVPVAGKGKLEIVTARSDDENTGDLTYTPANPNRLVKTKGFRTFRQVAYAGSFEGQTTVGLGVRARLPFRAFLLEGPGDGSRLVVDVAHRWSHS